MRVHLYEGGLTSLVAHSGVGQAICHQRAMLAEAGVEQADGWRGRADAVHINTVLPDAPLAALRARLRGETEVWYGHSTMEDFRESFVGSNRLAPLFRRWLCFCYGLADVVVTPTPYSRRILEGYGLKKPVYALSNGVDTEFFAPDPTRGAAWRARWQQRPGQKLVISVGHFMERKGILEFIDLARTLPEARFVWYGYTSPGGRAGAGRHGRRPRKPLFCGVCKPGRTAGRLLRGRCLRLLQPRGDRGHCGAGGAGLRRAGAGAGHPRL